MQEIGVRELKTHATEIICAVRDSGARYTITYRGRPVGVLLPLPRTDDAEPLQNDPWDELMRLGKEIAHWDWLDATPHGYSTSMTVHYAIWAYGLALLDNALLEPLSAVCAAEGRYEFMLTVAPLRVVGGRGSPVNPIALF